MRVIWLPQAQKQLRQTAKYIHREFGQKVRNDFIRDLELAFPDLHRKVFFCANQLKGI